MMEKKQGRLVFTTDDRAVVAANIERWSHDFSFFISVPKETKVTMVRTAFFILDRQLCVSFWIYLVVTSVVADMVVDRNSI